MSVTISEVHFLKYQEVNIIKQHHASSSSSSSSRLNTFFPSKPLKNIFSFLFKFSTQLYSFILSHQYEKNKMEYKKVTWHLNMHFKILGEFIRKWISGIVKSLFQDVFDYFLILFTLGMMHPDVILKPIVSTDVKYVVIKEVHVGNLFIDGQEFDVRDHMIWWICTKISKLDFWVITERSIIVQTEDLHLWPWDAKDEESIQLLYESWNTTDSRKCECPFKLVVIFWQIVNGYLMWFLVYINMTRATS